MSIFQYMYMYVEIIDTQKCIAHITSFLKVLSNVQQFTIVKWNTSDYFYKLLSEFEVNLKKLLFKIKNKYRIITCIRSIILKFEPTLVSFLYTINSSKQVLVSESYIIVSATLLCSKTCFLHYVLQLSCWWCNTVLVTL